MMDPRAELEELRRLEELERKAAGAPAAADGANAARRALADAYAGGDVSQMGAMERGLKGARAAFDQAAYGLGTLMPSLPISDETRNSINQNVLVRALGLTMPSDKQMVDTARGAKAFVDEGGAAATVGNITGEVATTLAPALRTQQALMAGARVLPQALQGIGRSLPSAMIAGGATSAALTPEDRDTAALGGALGAGAGELSGRVLTRTLGGAMSNRVTPEAQALMEQGAFVPMWKGTDSRIARNLAERAKVLPVAGNVIRQQERAGIESWNRILMREATPPTPVLDDAGNVLRWTVEPVENVGREGLNELGNRFERAYGALYGNRGIPIDETFGREIDSLVTGVERYYPSQANDVQGIVNRVVDTLTGPVQNTVRQTGGGPVGSGRITSRMTEPVVTTTTPGREVVSYQAVKTALDDVDRSIQSAWRQGNAEKAESLMALRDSIDALRTRGLPPEVASEAADINRAYAKFKTLERAASTLGAQKAGGVVTPAQQLSSIKARDRTPSKSAFARGNAPGQQQALTAQDVYGNQLPDVGPGTAEKLAPLMMFGAPMLLGDLGATSLLGTQTGQRFLMGQLPGQAAMRQYGNEYLIPALRQFGMQAGN